MTVASWNSAGSALAGHDALLTFRVHPNSSDLRETGSSIRDFRNDTMTCVWFAYAHGDHAAWVSGQVLNAVQHSKAVT
jgi:hypothetical protein